MALYYTDPAVVFDEEVTRLRAERKRKRIPDDLFYELLKWIPISTSDFVLTRLNPTTQTKEFMLGYRAEPPFQNTWFVPGGRLNYGEGVEEACRRHVKRELGIEDVAPRFVGHLSVMNPASETRPLWHSIWHLHEVEVPFDVLVKPNSENAKIDWFTTINDSFPDPVKAALRMLGFVS